MKHSKSSLFLMELIIAILFFALSSTVCIRLFAKSHLLSKETVNKNEAVIQAQNMAETYLAYEGDCTALSSLYPVSHYREEEALLTQFYDKNWEPVKQAVDGGFVLELRGSRDENGKLFSSIEASDNTPSVMYTYIYVSQISKKMLSDSVMSVHLDRLYELQFCHHVPERRGNLEKE